VFDNAVAGFDGFGVTVQEVGAVFEFVANVFTAIAETLRIAFNGFQVAGNLLALGLGNFLEGIGSWVSSDLEQFGKDMAANAQREGDKNFNEAMQAGSNAAGAASAAVFGSEPQAATNGPFGRAVRNARERMTPEERAKRQAEREKQQADKKAAREASAAEEKRKKAQEKAAKEAQDAAKKAARDATDAMQSAAREAESRRKKRADEMARKEDEISNASAFKEENAKALGEKSNEALKANDIRSGEGMSQFLALATGREDPAIAEYRKSNEKLQQIVAELRALQQQPVDMLGAAA
jgi:flagellar biosynthesis GTPase FlhF